MKFLLDFFPIALFLAVYKIKDLHFYNQDGMHSAIIAMAIAILIQILITRISSNKFEKAQLIGLMFLVVFGGITIYVDNPIFIMWKVSALYVVFALTLILSIWIGEKTLLQRMLGKEMQLPKKVWNQLTWLWGVGFSGIAFVNAYYYVIPSITANDNFFGNEERFGLSGFDCLTSANQQTCITAQQAEASWVYFKMFGTMGLTFALIIITVIFISKYIKEEK